MWRWEWSQLKMPINKHVKGFHRGLIQQLGVPENEKLNVPLYEVRLFLRNSHRRRVFCRVTHSADHISHKISRLHSQAHLTNKVLNVKIFRRTSSVPPKEKLQQGLSYAVNT